ncbi:MAG TPA: adenylate/guanylate cyclase domain-containing protein [Kofleriaceae bacterium]|nr:adenylate/guanylate cyclase domain-containing protein [Kofleriaceae bacterium]
MEGLAQTGMRRSIGRRDRAPRRRAPRDSGGTGTSRRIRQQGLRMTIACASAALAGGALALVWPSFAIQTRIGLALVAVIAAAFYGLALSVPWHGGESRRWPVLASAVEVTLASAAIAVLAVFEGPASVAGGAGTGVYMVAVTLAATRMRAGVSLFATGLAIACWLVIHLALVHPALPGAAWVPLVERMTWLALVGLIGAGAARALRERTHLVGARMERRLESELGRYVSRDVARDILRGRINLKSPQRRTVTVLFCDLRGFTFLCERETPEDVVHILETFYEEAFAIVEKHGGTINKILGDGLLALFNAPNQVPQHAIAAADAASEIMRMMYGLRERGGVWTHLAIGIGLDTGEIVVGPIGSAERAEYTAIGSPVNRAARLQSLADRESRRIILSEATRRALGSHTPVDALGLVELKGFVAPERVYSLPFRPRASDLHAVP